MTSDEHAEFSRMAERHRADVEVAGTIREILDIVAQARSHAGQSDWSYIVYPSIFTWAMPRAYTIDPENDLTLKLERQWVKAFDEACLPVSPATIEETRAEAKYWKVLRPMVRRHNALCEKAVSPEDLMPIVHDVTENIPTEMDARFQESALGDAYETAWLLDPEHACTEAIGKELDRVAGGRVSKMIAEELDKQRGRKR